MSNPYYNASGSPITGSPGSSAVVRNEFTNIAAGFALLPELTAGTAVVVNSGGTALTNTTGTLALGAAFATTGGFGTTLAEQAATTLTLPASSDTLVGRATTDTLTNKTLTAPVLSGTITGTYTLGGTPTISGATFTDLTLDGTTTIGGTLTGGTISGITLSGTTTAADGATWTSSGIASLAALGIGMTPVNVLDITQTQNAPSAISLLNTSTGSSALTQIEFNNGTDTGFIGLLGVGRTDGAWPNGPTGPQVYVGGNGAVPLVFGTDDAFGGMFDTNGRFLLGFTADQGGGQPLQVNGGALIAGNLNVAGTLNPGTALGVAYGGTAATTFTAHGVLIGEGTSAVTASSAGTAGQVLTSNGSSADPTFQDAAGLGSIANNDLLANTSGASAAPIGTTLSALIDAAIGSTRGALLERGSSGWALLGPGTSGDVLTSNGTGADPSYQSAVSLPGEGEIGAYAGAYVTEQSTATAGYTLGTTYTLSGFSGEWRCMGQVYAHNFGAVCTCPSTQYTNGFIFLRIS